MPNRVVQPIHFEDFDGHQFERLVFAYLWRTGTWQSLDWYGQAGGDSGRDIWGVREQDGNPHTQKVCYQCANLKSLSYKKVQDDVEKVLGCPNGKPDIFIIVAGGVVSAALKDKAKKLCEQKQIDKCEVWSGKEFEERLRANGESLLKRFIEGKLFPESPAELCKFSESILASSDKETLAVMASLFDRPAFYTPFQGESSVPDFKKAITDTIEALNTGICRLRDGTEIRRIPSRHTLQSTETKRALARIERMLVELRAQYDEYLRTGDIRPCGCDSIDCPVFMCSPRAVQEMDRMRMALLNAFHDLDASFEVRVGWGL
jgi:hypothetical protein